MWDDDATRMMPSPDVHRLRRESRDGDEPMRIVESLRQPEVGVRAVGETYYGDTQFGSVPSMVAGSAEAPKPERARHLAPKTRAVLKTKVPSKRETLVHYLQTHRAFIGLAIAVAAASCIGKWVLSGSHPKQVNTQAPVSVAAPTHPPLPAANTTAVATSAIHAPQREESQSGEVEAAARPATAESNYSADEVTRLARLALRAVRAGNCAQAQNTYRSLAALPGAEGTRWQPFLSETLRSCQNKRKP